jgi:iron-sulfur cluster assembly protein
MSYTLNYATERGKFDEEVSAKGVRVFVEPRALMSVLGTTMDWRESALAAEFVFNNPNAKGACGCGESFNV